MENLNFFFFMRANYNNICVDTRVYVFFLFSRQFLQDNTFYNGLFSAVQLVVGWKGTGQGLFLCVLAHTLWSSELHVCSIVNSLVTWCIGILTRTQVFTLVNFSERMSHAPPHRITSMSPVLSYQVPNRNLSVFQKKLKNIAPGTDSYVKNGARNEFLIFL